MSYVIGTVSGPLVRKPSMNCHEYQRMVCEGAGRPVLNTACKEDPARLGELFDAINLDINEFDPHTQVHGLASVKNFMVGDARALPWKEPLFRCVVLGEILEHCTHTAALDILLEAARVLLPDGVICVTFPLDARPPEAQHQRHLLVQWDNGITSWHQTQWTDDLFFPLLREAGLRQLDRIPIDYPFLPGQAPQGWGYRLTHTS
jgi:SAM-dependent methyltransferase